MFRKNAYKSHCSKSKSTTQTIYFAFVITLFDRNYVQKLCENLSPKDTIGLQLDWLKDYQKVTNHDSCLILSYDCKTVQQKKTRLPRLMSLHGPKKGFSFRKKPYIQSWMIQFTTPSYICKNYGLNTHPLQQSVSRFGVILWNQSFVTPAATRLYWSIFSHGVVVASLQVCC